VHVAGPWLFNKSISQFASVSPFTSVSGLLREERTTEDRDGMLQSGMEGGVNESYAALDEVLESLVA
jgi:hypothetical protein